MGRTRSGRLAELALYLLVGVLVLGALLGQPMLVGFVESGSMEPTLDAGDGFVAIPAPLAGPIEEGDVVVYRAERLHGGGLTTHRVVGETDQGYVTQGDANPSTDQAGDEPPVKETQVVATALQVGGTVVSIPHVGTVVGAVQAAVAPVRDGLRTLGLDVGSGTTSLGYVLFGASVLWWGLDLLRNRGRTRRRTRAVGYRPHRLLLVLTLVVLAGVTAPMVLPADAEQFAFVSSNHDTPGPSVVGVGETETTTYEVPNAGVAPMVVVLEPRDGIRVDPRDLHLGPGERATATVTLEAPPETGYYRRYLVEHRYLAVLPPAHLRTLYAVHPWFPIVVIDALVGGAFYLAGRRVLGRARLRPREHDRPSRVRRVVARWT